LVNCSCISKNLETRRKVKEFVKLRVTYYKSLDLNTSYD